ncbi:hypothetical protein CYMTET_47871 [Cymbomonas tetramitiformis]|uniref:Rieske domain-containing protein n=1 Tax=Cymbomonas tetramitiformis TaxID=36881 RepID=A0AAE0BV51_9CHLO|nr:hypothetical protein CYMTET_47871 [Cymbomonas tetramitiformis]
MNAKEASRRDLIIGVSTVLYFCYVVLGAVSKEIHEKMFMLVFDQEVYNTFFFPAFLEYHNIFRVHVLAAGVWLVTGALQFTQRKRGSLHRRAGYVYILASFVKGVTAGGLCVKSHSLGFARYPMLLSTVWDVISLMVAWRMILLGEIARHRKWMQRNFVVGFGSVVARILGAAWALVELLCTWTMPIPALASVERYRFMNDVVLLIGFVGGPIAFEVYLRQQPRPLKSGGQEEKASDASSADEEVKSRAAKGSSDTSVFIVMALLGVTAVWLKKEVASEDGTLPVDMQKLQELWRNSTTALISLAGDLPPQAPWVMLAAIVVSYFSWFQFSKVLKPTVEGNPYAAGTYRRRQLDQIRKNSKQFPPPFPNGWYRVCNSDDVARGEVIPVTMCGQELVVFRGKQDDKVGVLHAFCPHLGTHMGHGGWVRGNDLVCPYHHWSFTCEGMNTDIPYCSSLKAPRPEDRATPKRVNAKHYAVRERLGMVLIWMHAEGDPPSYEMDYLDELDAPDTEYRFVARAQFENFKMHIMEPSQNTADWYHFQTVHKWMGQSDSDNFKLLQMGHSIKCQYGTQGDKVDHEGKVIPDGLLILEEKVASLKLFGLIKFPDWFTSCLTSYIYISTPGIIKFVVQFPILGKWRGIMTLSPDEPFSQRMQYQAYASKGTFPWPLARILQYLIMRTVEQDRLVWEHKSHVAPRNLVAGDGPFAAFGKWWDQFYSENSATWGQSLEW